MSPECSAVADCARPLQSYSRLPAVIPAKAGVQGCGDTSRGGRLPNWYRLIVRVAAVYQTAEVLESPPEVTNWQELSQGTEFVEFGDHPTVAVLGMLLADQGADVVKVESPEGDPLRGTPVFAVWNRGKRSVAVGHERPPIC